MATYKTGGEVDAFCTKCKLQLAHTILAMVGEKIARVRCNTCGGDHAYRSPPGVIPSRPSRPSAAPRASSAAAQAEKIVIGFAERISAKDPSTAKRYSVKETFVVEELIIHPTFGLGIVSAVRADKVEVAFKAEVKTLVHGRGDGSTAPKPSYHRPAPTSSGPADKPMAEEAQPAPVAEES